MLKLIVCLDKNNGLSKDGHLAWNIKEEMEHFKQTTLNSIVVMGRKTYESIGRLLPNRKNIIFSRNKTLKIKNATIADDIDKIISLSKKNDVFIIGGKEIYQLFIDEVDELIISRLNKDYNCDLFWKPNLKWFTKIKIKSFKDFKVYYYVNNKEKILNGTKTSELIIKELIHQKNKLVMKYHDIPKLVIIHIGEDFGSSIYVKNKVKLGQKIGIDVKVINQKEISIKNLTSLITRLNNDKKTHGILVQHPLPKNIDENLISSMINPLKDVDCFHPENIGNVFKNLNSEFVNSIPCTPWGIIGILKNNNIEIASKNVVVIGRSNIVGKPLVPLLLNENATVTICHSKTHNLKKITKNADILISAVGKANFINKSFIKQNAIIIDVGIQRDENNNICGDVDFVDCLKEASKITPVPKGIGPMTLTMLFANLIKLYKKQQLVYKKK